ncbi:hypothetical protein V7O66_12550 [Methanolobus sp. ZRKC3]|uniref:hypothetical protein n=1 Tax=Methanolobus sp. ZRKC3 TaxID=3125786 RepID=UPI00324DAE13
MKSKTMKVLAGLSLVLMVFSIMPSGALAEQTDVVEEGIGNILEHRKDHGARHEMAAEYGMNKADMERPEFKTEEEEFEFVKERMLSGAEMRIERLENAIENIDEIENEVFTEKTLSEEIAEIRAFIEEINSVSDLEELKDTCETMRENAPGTMGKAGMERPEFETEEEEFKFVKERMLNDADMKIVRLENTIENIDEIENEEITEETLSERIAEIREIIEDINGASDLEELKDIREEMRENAPGKMGRDHFRQSFCAKEN